MFHCLFVIYMNLITKYFHKSFSVFHILSLSLARSEIYFPVKLFPPKKNSKVCSHVCCCCRVHEDITIIVRIVSINSHHNTNIQWCLIKDMRFAHKLHSKFSNVKRKFSQILCASSNSTAQSE